MRIFQPHAANEILADAAPGFDAATLTQRDVGLLHVLGRLLRRLRPDVAHLHDFAPFGVEFVALLRREVPKARIVISLGPDFARRAGLLGGAEFLHTAMMRRFLREADAILLPCESLRAPALAFGLDALRLHRHKAAPALPVTRTRRWLVIAAFPGTEAEARMVATAALMLAGHGLPGPRRLRLELHGAWAELPEIRGALDCPGSPLALVPETAGGGRMAAAHLAVLPAGAEALRAEAAAARCPVLEAPPNAPALAEALLDLLEQPERLERLEAALGEAPSPATAAAALLRHYRP